MDNTNNNICEIKNISKVFPGVVALKNVSFKIKKGEIHAIIGENGAGKSTLMNILDGLYTPTKGKVIFDGNILKIKDAKQAQNVGIAMIHQELSLSPTMSVAENIFMGRMIKNRFGLINKNEMVNKSKMILEKLGVSDINPKTKIKDLNVSRKQLVEIVKAISLNAKLLIMDEPTSSLTVGEISFLLDLMKSLKENGVSILFITHKIEEVLEVADRITVLRDGEYIGTINSEDATTRELISMMVGQEFEQEAKRELITDYSNREVVLEVRNLNAISKFKNVNFKLYKGEVLGLTGLVGAGRTELLRCIFGMDNMSSGTILIKGRKVNIKHPADSISMGLGLIPEDRKEQGMFLKLSVRDNITMVNLKNISSKLSFISNRKQNQLADKYLKVLDVRTTGLSQIAENLSGGNQQKIVIARWLMNDPSILLMDEPTHGIDVGTKAEIYNIINELSKNGVSIILLSSEMEEVIALCDRIMVMHEGEIKDILSRDKVSKSKIMSTIMSK